MNLPAHELSDILDDIRGQKIHSFRAPLFGLPDAELILTFFHSPLENKTTFSDGILGYVPYGIEYSGERDAPDMIESYTLHSTASQVPDNPIEHALRPSLESIESFAKEISWRILTALNNEQAPVDPRLFDSASFLRVVYYPPFKTLPTAGKGGMRHGEHVDAGFITLFPFGVSSGLQYLDNNTWRDVPPAEDAFLLSGQILELITGGTIPALRHRVKPSPDNLERLTIQYFIIANDAAQIPFFGVSRPPDEALNSRKYFESYLAQTMSFANKALLPVNFDALAPFWELYEMEGVNAQVISDLAPAIRNPVLVLGSGQGLVSATLTDYGHDVTSVDASATMAQYALSRRTIRTELADARSFVSARAYRTVIVSTGVINDRNVGTEGLDDLLENIKKLMMPDGSVIYGHFLKADWHDAAQSLGIYGPPSANVFFWQSDGNLDLAKKKFREKSSNPDAVDELFEVFRPELEKQSALIMRLGGLFMQRNGRSPVEFIARQSGFYPFDLTQQNSVRLLHQLQHGGFDVTEQRTYHGGDTRVLITRLQQ